MDIVGFVRIKDNATTCKGARNPNEFIGKTCAVMEFGQHGSILVLNHNGSALAMFDNEDIQAQFKCGGIVSGVVCPPNLHQLEKMMYVGKALGRKGGYNNLVMNMVIQASLMKGEFTDNFLWQCQ
jgi:hypothetical protein